MSLQKIVVAWMVISVSAVFADKDFKKEGQSDVVPANPSLRKNSHDSTKQKHPYIWVDLLGGTSTPGLACGLRLNTDFYLGFMSSIEFIVSSGILNEENAVQKKVMLGKRISDKFFYAYFFVGVAHITGKKKGRMIDDGSSFLSFGPKYEYHELNTFGVPVEFGFAFARLIGIGLSLQANFSKDYPGLGFLLNIPVGKVT
ncbi:hypothetical protein ACFL5V_11940 [Fibrobacterota bacterium]